MLLLGHWNLRSHNLFCGMLVAHSRTKNILYCTPCKYKYSSVYNALHTYQKGKYLLNTQ